MKIIKRLLIILLILVIILAMGIFGLVYSLIRDDHVPYIDMIEKYSEENKLDKKMVTAIIRTESNFKSKAKSGAGARGLMQIMPETGKWVASKLEEEFKEENLLDPETNIRYGTYYFKYLTNYYKNYDYAIIAYNAGHGNVDKWIESGILTGKQSDYANIPFAESKDYIRKVRKQYQLNEKIYDIYYKDNKSSKIEKTFNLLKAFGKEIVK